MLTAIKAMSPQVESVWGEEWHGTSFFDEAAEDELRRLIPNPNPADVRMAIQYTSSYARRLARVAGEPLPERGFVPAACMSIFRYNLMKMFRARQMLDMMSAKQAKQLPILHIN